MSVLYSDEILTAARAMTGHKNLSRRDLNFTMLLVNVKHQIGMTERMYPILPFAPPSSDTVALPDAAMCLMYGDNYATKSTEARKTALRYDLLHHGPKLVDMASHTPNEDDKRLGIVMVTERVFELWDSGRGTVKQILAANKRVAPYVGFIAFGNTNGEFIAGWSLRQLGKGKGLKDHFDERTINYSDNEIYGARVQEQLTEGHELAFGLLKR